MNNEQRRLALATARRMCLEYAEQTEVTDYDDAYDFTRTRQLAIMWAHVAQAMKTGEPQADGVIPVVEFNHTITR